MVIWTNRKCWKLQRKRHKCIPPPLLNIGFFSKRTKDSSSFDFALNEREGTPFLGAAKTSNICKLETALPLSLGSLVDFAITANMADTICVWK